MPDLLSAFRGVRKAGDGWGACCPAHEDRKASLSISAGDDGRWLLHCHAGCEIEAILAAAGLEVKDLFEDLPSKGERRIVAVFDYTTPAGDVAYQTVKYEPKDFRQRRPDGKGGYIWSTKGLQPLIYRRHELSGRPTALVAEGEKDCDALWSVGMPATCNHGGAGRWTHSHAAQLSEAGIKNVIVVPDADMPGRNHAKSVARSCLAAGLVVKVVTLPDNCKDVSAFFDAGHDKDELARLIESESIYTATEAAEAAANVVAVPVVQTISTVTREGVSWLWPRRIARRKLNIVAGEPGEGKSTVTLDVAARITQGAAWPDGGHASKGSVLLLSAEDGLGDTIAPRLDAARADATCVHALTAIRQTDGRDRHLDLGRDMPQLEDAIQQVRPVLVVIDPLSAYLGRIDSWKDNEVRSLLSPLAAMADRHNCAVLGVMHLSKASGRKALHRLLGSIGFSAAARVVLAVASDPGDDSRRLLLPVKNNLTPKADVLAFRLWDGRIEWDADPVEGVTADGVLNELPSESGDRQDADTFLRKMLSGGEPVPSRVIAQAARDNKIADRTLKRAKSRLGVRAKLVGFGAGGKWHWWLPLSVSTEGATRSSDVAAEDAKFPESATQKVAPSGPLCEIETTREGQESATSNMAPSVELPTNSQRSTEGANRVVEGGTNDDLRSY